ncbi:hypothetical protein Hamer_G000779 [Homarus americanus]|uniref:Uncharacterized protein n=1 Tax=Homarus americanus TaxID=6706 RepID=A0A8J5TCB1_HOMAM|nr:hypothetical protein Hamer_G000779 [Homarus americanus]
MHFGVLQESVLEPILFTVYTSSLTSKLDAHVVAYHLYANETHLYVKIINVKDIEDNEILDG